MSISRSAILALAASSVLFGCGAITDKVTETATERAIEEAVEAGSDADVDINKDGDGFSLSTDEGSMTVDGDGNMVIETEDGTVNVESGDTLPDDFPDLPLPDGLKIDATSRMMDDNDAGTLVHTVSGVLDSDPQSVFKSIVADMKSAGFESMFNNEATSDGEFSGSAMFSKGEDMQVFVNVFSQDGGALIQLSVTDLAAN